MNIHKKNSDVQLEHLNDFGGVFIFRRESL